MKAIAYSIKPFEKEFLAKANQKKHDITLISNALSLDTASYAEGKNVVIVFNNDDASAPVIEKLAGFGIKYIVTRSVSTDHIDKIAVAKHGIKLAFIPHYSATAIAEHTVALAFALNRKLVKADKLSHLFDFRYDGLIGFNFFGKTVGIIGVGKTGKAVAKIFNGIGCKIVGYDPVFPSDSPYISPVSLPELLATSDIISLHLPLTSDTKYLIQHDTLKQMKDGVMLINASRGAIIKTRDILEALDTGKVGYLGLDVCEYEKSYSLEDNDNDFFKDPLLKNLLEDPNVLVTPHQAYLTREALQEVADQTIKSLDLWQKKVLS